MMQVTKKMIRQTILNDCILLETEPRLLLGVEQTLSTTVDTALGQVRLEGKIDRIDMTQSSGEVRIIDYKTGSVTPNDLKIKEIELLTNSPDFPKAFQLMQYALMYSDAHPGKPVTAGNISLRNHTQGFISPQFPDTFSSSMEALVEFKTNLIQLIENMLDKNQSFCQTENKDLCTFCDYKQICNRT
jgi:CRISPR/Cas system-associated exonuclease Cas4 (RecB family)